MSSKELEIREFNDGETIIQENETGNEMFVILSGKAKVFKEGDGEQTTLAILKEEDFFGEMALFDNRPRSASVKAVGKVKVAVLTRETFLEEIKTNSKLAFQVLEKMSARIRAIDTRFHHLTLQLQEIKDSLLII